MFEGNNVALEYFFDGGIPGCVKMLWAWEESVDKRKPIFEKGLEDERGGEKGGLKGIHRARFVIASK